MFGHLHIRALILETRYFPFRPLPISLICYSENREIKTLNHKTISNLWNDRKAAISYSNQENLRHIFRNDGFEHRLKSAWIYVYPKLNSAWSSVPFERPVAHELQIPWLLAPTTFFNSAKIWFHSEYVYIVESAKRIGSDCNCKCKQSRNRENFHFSWKRLLRCIMELIKPLWNSVTLFLAP